MFDIMRRETSVIPVDDDQAVCELQAAHSLALQEVSAAEAKVARLHRIIEGSEKTGDDGEFFEAKAALQEAQGAVQRAKAKALRVSGQLTLTREAARRRLDEARAELRRPLINAIFAKFEEAVQASERLIEFDAATSAMGGSVSEFPCPGLLRSVYEFQRNLAVKDGLLS